MAMTEEEVTDILWEEMKTFAIEQQQCLYELLPDCTIYKSDEHIYLKQNIGYSIYGPPESTKNTSAMENSSCYCKTENLNDTDVADIVGYNKKAQEIIDKIYDKICTYTIKIDDSQPIYFGIIYNIIFRPKQNIKSKEKDVKKEAKKETKTEIEEEPKKNEKEPLAVSFIPIFKIRKNVQKESKIKKSAKQENTNAEIEEIQYETWYIDVTGRIYKSWTNYIENNHLPECTMVLPKNGFYQSNPIYSPTEDYSTVWLEIVDSHACTWTAKFCNGMDVVSSVVGFGTVGLTVASMFTPLAPVVVASGFVAAGVTSVWSLGRNSQQLADRSSHEESIHVLDKEAFPHYLGIAGTAFGLGAVGGSVIISNVAARGMTVNTFTRLAFNIIQGGNLVLNGIGLVYQSYCMIDKYRKEKTVSFGDALNLATHLMFFYGSVVKIQFASDIIESTQGRIIDDYKETLRNRRLRKKYNRVARNAAENNICKMSENAEVIRYIRHRQELLSSNKAVTNSGNRTLDSNASRNIVWSCERGRLRVNGIILLDPIDFVTYLIRAGIFIEKDQNNSQNADDSTVDQLARVLCDLLSKFYISDDCPKSMKLPIVSDFEPLLREMHFIRIDEDSLQMLFKISVKLLKRSKNMNDFLFQCFTFIWQYCKTNLKQWGMSCYTQSVSGSNILRKIIFAVFHAIDMMLDNLYEAFVMYINSNLHTMENMNSNMTNIKKHN